MLSSVQFREFVVLGGSCTGAGDELNDFGARGAPAPLWLSPIPEKLICATPLV